MANINRLQRLKELLWQKYDDEIRYEGDWFYFANGYTYNFIYDNEQDSCFVYKRINGVTDYSQEICLEKRVRKWITVV